MHGCKRLGGPGTEGEKATAGGCLDGCRRRQWDGRSSAAAPAGGGRGRGRGRGCAGTLRCCAGGRSRNGRSGLRQVFDTSAPTGSALRSIDWHKCSVNNTPSQVEVVRRSAQITSVTVKRGSESILGLDGGCETGERVGGARRGRNALIGEPFIRWERLEQFHDGFEECHSFGALGAASGKARNIQSAHAGSVRLPLVLPQFLIGTIVGVVFPEGIHEAEGRAGALGRKQTGNARVRARGVAVLLEGQVALIGP